MHILLVYLQRAQPEESPMVATLLLQLDLMVILFSDLDISIRSNMYRIWLENSYVIAVMLQGDPLKHSVYRDEAVEAIIVALDCHTCNEKVQEQSARALLLLGGRFSYTGEPTAEKQLLKQAGFDDNTGDSCNGKDIVLDKFIHQVSLLYSKFKYTPYSHIASTNAKFC